MHRKFIALIIGASIAITTLSAAPARADDQTAKLLAGIAAIALIGAALHDANNNDTAVVQTPNHPNGYVGTDRRALKPWQHRGRYQGNVLPGYCMREINTGRGQTERFLGRHCLNNSHTLASQLPQVCAERLWTRARVRNGYDPQCLRSYGYVIDKR